MEIHRDGAAQETKEYIKNYELSLVIHRHGEKSDLDGDLTEAGKQEVADFMYDAYSGMESFYPDSAGIQIVHSPVNRVKETADIAKENLGTNPVISITEDPRLTEGDIAKYRDILIELGGVGGKWVQKWMELQERPRDDVKTGQEVARDFASFLLEKIKKNKQTGGTEEIMAFSHFPAMMAFLVALQENISIQILPENWKEEITIDYLDWLDIISKSDDSENIQIIFKGVKAKVPIEILQKMAA